MRRHPAAVIPYAAVVLLTLASPIRAQGPEPVRLNASLLADLMANVEGGVRRAGSAMVLGGLTVDVDGQALLSVPGLAGHVTIVGAWGRGPSVHVGDIQGPSNIAAPEGVFPFEVWLQQNLPGRISVLAGLYDLNSEFDVLEVAGLFLNSSFGIGPDFALSGPNGPSVFPTTGLGVRAAVAISPSLRLRLALIDGTPGDPADPDDFDPWIRPGDGALLVTEVALGGGTPDARAAHPRVGRRAATHPRRVALGVWRYAGLSDAGSACCGVYALAETRLSVDPGDPDRVLGLFARAGSALRGQSAVSAYVGFGVTARGLARSTDELGLGVALAWPDPMHLETKGFPTSREAPEQVVELSYRVGLADGLSVQPDLQYVAHPAGTPGSTHAVLLSLRVGISP
ncbi:MAG: carbohydrate porin [Longimicrobiales bacterium]|nr:carbohydrate porin [Longimicrobiales bacterium]